MTRLTLQILVVTVFVSQFSRAQDWINVVADPSKFVKNAGAMEFRFFAIDKNGKGDEAIGRSVYFVNNSQNLEAIAALLKDRKRNLSLFSTGGAATYSCVLVLYDDYPGTKITLPALIVGDADGLYGKIISICEREQKRRN
jgi:hypothetical protein